MRRLTITVRFHGNAARPSGEPPQTEPRASSVSVEESTSDGSPFGIESASYSNRATHTGESTFTETGTISFSGANGELDIATVGEGTLGLSADADLLHGAVVYRITAGRGRFDGASGLITSNFLLRPATGVFEERQVAVVFLP